MKYGLFCLTFAYFRALHNLRQEKATWDGSNDLVSLHRHGLALSEERKKMIEEEKNAEFRRSRIEHAMEKAKGVEKRKIQRLEAERLEKVRWSWCSAPQSIARFSLTFASLAVGQDQTLAQQAETSV